MTKQVLYYGLPCYLIEAESPFPKRVQILCPKDLKKDENLGFFCWGFPSEVAKEITEEEYDCLCRFGRFPLIN